MINKRALGLFAAAAVATLSSAALAAPPPTQNLRGTIASVTSSALTLTTATGPVTIELGPKTFVAGAVAGSSADIAPGKFLGIASVPGGVTSRALEVVVFDESMRGVGEGDYPWDLAAPQGHSAMTNGTVAAPRSTMTNGNVGAVGGTGQKTISLTYKGGSRRIVVPPNAPVVRVAPTTRAAIVPGAAAFVIATKDAKPGAVFVVVGKDGVKPPM